MKPILLLDVDGVLCPWGDPPEGYRQVWFNQECDWISGENARRLQELMKSFEIVWCTARDLTVLDTIGPAHRLPPFEVIEFGTMKTPGRGRSGILVPVRFNGQTWKLDWVHRWSEQHKDRALAWVDDELYADAYEWARDRESGVLWMDTGAPTLLIQPDSNTGISADDFAALDDWASRLQRET